MELENFMTSLQLEKRIVAVEAELTRLKEKVEGAPTHPRWWDGIADTFTDDPVYAAAMKLGRKYRQSQQSTVSNRNRK